MFKNAFRFGAFFALGISIHTSGIALGGDREDEATQSREFVVRGLAAGLYSPDGYIRHTISRSLLQDHAASPISEQLVVEAIFSEIFREQPMGVLAGAIPAGSLNGINPVLVRKTLDRLKSEGRLSNKDIDYVVAMEDPEYFAHAAPLGPYSKSYDFLFYSRRGIARLLSCPKAVALLHEAGFTSTDTVEDATAAFRQFIETNYVRKMSRKSDDIIYGLFNGFPADDVRAFSETPIPNKSSGTFRVGDHLYMDLGNDRFGFGFARFSATSLAEIAWKRARIRHAYEIYDRLLTSPTLGNLALFNRWQELQPDCEYALEAEPGNLP